MVDHVDYLIAYAWHPASNARELVEYANTKKRLKVTEIYTKASHKTNKYNCDSPECDAV